MPTQSLPPLNRQFVAHFGEMGSKWGINRTVGQIYALIFISERALNADEIAELLEFSRSNVSMGLKELQAWRLVRLRHHPGDRQADPLLPGAERGVGREVVDTRRGDLGRVVRGREGALERTEEDRGESFTARRSRGR